MSDIRRILVALEPGYAQSRIPELAARIAAEISAEIDALLVQDAALMMAADLPLAQEILVPTGTRRNLTRQTLALDFQALARKLERRFEQLAGGTGLHWTLRSVLGNPIAQIVAAAGEGDLLMLGLPRDAAFGIDAMRQIARQARRPAVFIGDLASSSEGLFVFDGETELERGLPTVVGLLARAFQGAPTIYHHPPAGEIGDLRRRAILVLPGRPDEESDGGPELP